MALAQGMRLGPYEVLAPLGAGGMGEVWRARDTRLGREVAVKVLPDEVAKEALALSRFEHEAKAVAALSHPNILAIFDVGEAGGVHYAVTELLEGENLRALASDGPLPVRRALEISEQIAQGLAAAHEKGIVHRDVKPENVFLTKDGHVKILDFGLARARAVPAGRDETESPTVEKLTSGGAVVGTVAYMSPEQARGLPVDHRSDQFSLGIVLYEMLAGRRPFRGSSAAETLTAIIREEPELLSRSTPSVPAPVRWLVERCLAKEPGERYDSTRDLARELSSCRAHLSEATSGAVEPVSTTTTDRGRRRAALLGLLAAALVGLGFAGAFALLRGSAKRPEPKFQRLTFKRGTITGARFAPDGRTVVYSAAWGEEPLQLFSVRLDGPESRPLGFLDTALLAVSPTSELALGLGALRRPSVEQGTLAVVPFSGGTPRALAERVSSADFSPDGSKLAVVREAPGGGGDQQLEYPVGTVLFKEPPSGIGSPRVSPRGNQVAFVRRPRGDTGGSVMVVAPGEKARQLSGDFMSIGGLGWSPRGDEVWFTGAKKGSRLELFAVDLSGRERRVHSGLGSIVLQDIAGDGRILASTSDDRGRVFFGSADLPVDRELSWFDFSSRVQLSRDGKVLHFAESGEAAGGSYLLFVRGTDGSPPARIGTWRAGDFSRLSPDGRFVAVSRVRPPAIEVIPIGAGATLTIPLSGFDESPVRLAGLLADGRTVWFVGTKPPGGLRYWITDPAGPTPRPASPDIERAVWPGITPGEESFLGRIEGNRLALLPRFGGEPRFVPGVSEGDLIAGVSSDGRSLFVYRPGNHFPVAVRRVDVATGQSEPLREISPPDRAGAMPRRITLTPDGRHYAYNLSQDLGELYVIEGLK